jgi:Cu-Zn family superoxide dismutase
MRVTSRSLLSRLLVPALALSFTAAACSDDDKDASKPGGGGTSAGGSDAGATGGGADSGGGSSAKSVGKSMGAWAVYDLMGMPNPAMGITGSVTVSEPAAGKTEFKLEVMGAMASREFGAHLHVAVCDPPGQGGGHHQHVARPADAGATDPMWANMENEVWMDFTTDAMGKASKTVTASWKLDTARAKSVVVHAMKTGAGGAAGTKLACVNLKWD